MSKYIISLIEKSKLKIQFVLRVTDCPVFEVKAKSNVSVPSDVINRSKSIEYRINGYRRVVHSDARTRFDDKTKISLQILGVLG